MKAKKVLGTLVALMMLTVVLPSTVSATEIGKLSTVETKEENVIVNDNFTSSSLKELSGLSLSDSDTLYVSYYNATNTLVHGSASAYKDSNDVVWFNVSSIISTANSTNRQAFFSDEEITDSNYANASEALLVNETISEDKSLYTVTIPGDTKFTYDKYQYKYNSSDIVIYDDEGNEKGNITSFEYNSTRGVYAFNVSKDDTVHKIAFIAKTPHTDSTEVTGERVVKDSWIPFMDTTEKYTMKKESTDEYTFFSSDDGYIAFDVYDDYGTINKYMPSALGLKTKFIMSNDSLKYEKSKYLGLSKTWQDISAHEAGMSGLNMGLVKVVEFDSADSSDESDEYTKYNYGIIISKGEETSVSGLDYITMWTSRVPTAKLDTSSVKFE
ncbi:MAG: hypothetical protein V5A63_19520 [Bacteroides sp.]|uniref:hypothetical protein n=1 Tax=Bacteroides sp. TaxID=29523 RepID=UPI002FC3A27D